MARRRRRMREALLTAGARQFVNRGVARVSVEDLLAEADVSRATFYAMFSNKYSLLENILNPILTRRPRRFVISRTSRRAGGLRASSIPIGRSGTRIARGYS